MLDVMQTATLYAPAEAVDVSPEIRFEDSSVAAPLESSRYSSVLDDALADNAIHQYKDKLRQIALHPVKLHAGQSSPPNGGIGRFAAPQAPEIIGGGLVGINL